MDLAPYVDNLRSDLAAAAEAASAEVRDAASRLSYAVEPSLRMVLLDALGVAAAEITEQLSAGVVEVRLRGRDPEFVVGEAATPAPEAEPAEPVAAADAEEGVARVSLRLPESVKSRVEEAAAASGQSVNAWLVRAVVQTLDGPPDYPSRSTRETRVVGQRIAGWQR
ncbi:MAG TPA: toxin-antitoxin system HicB family antitoxin [Jiangellales bacterium]|nr:toxin-antitoxin system HicB family antitoxin [Jiangellales bacterium]